MIKTLQEVLKPYSKGRITNKPILKAEPKVSAETEKASKLKYPIQRNRTETEAKSVLIRDNGPEVIRRENCKVLITAAMTHDYKTMGKEISSTKTAKWKNFLSSIHMKNVDSIYRFIASNDGRRPQVKEPQAISP